MSRSPFALSAVEELLDDAWLDIDALCRATGVSALWLRERVAAGYVIAQRCPPEDALRFDSTALRRVRCMAQLERDFDAVPELAALVADMQDELARLRNRLRSLGVDEDALL